ncbi:hypothetical protein J2X92_004387 [Variovorax paradoxus]|nr:hypothetical protein [Variovorax paradoxus]
MTVSTQVTLNDYFEASKLRMHAYGVLMKAPGIDRFQQLESLAVTGPSRATVLL